MSMELVKGKVLRIHLEPRQASITTYMVTMIVEGYDKIFRGLFRNETGPGVQHLVLTQPGDEVTFYFYDHVPVAFVGYSNKALLDMCVQFSMA